jgi:hypothetical protein
MKRDMDLLRALLLKVEETPAGTPTGTGRWFKIAVDGYTADEVCYNALLAKDAGLIEAKFLGGSNEFVVQRLTFAGHEFLDAAREDKVWNKAKQTILSNAGALTLEAMKTALSMLMQHAAHGKIA